MLSFFADLGFFSTEAYVARTSKRRCPGHNNEAPTDHECALVIAAGASAGLRIVEHSGRFYLLGTSGEERRFEPLRVTIHAQVISEKLGFKRVRGLFGDKLVARDGSAVVIRNRSEHEWRVAVIRLAAMQAGLGAPDTTVDEFSEGARQND
ncbi:MAG: hypothetical protein EPN77_19420 [Candidimonas sp.]|nr:MAG: hypothetical protein EPN77_19420 [Candidimonas sp.]